MAAILAETVVSAENAVLLDHIALISQKLYHSRQEVVDMGHLLPQKHSANNRSIQPSLSLSQHGEVSQNLSELCESKHQPQMLTMSKGFETLVKPGETISAEEMMFSEVVFVIYLVLREY